MEGKHSLWLCSSAETVAGDSHEKLQGRLCRLALEDLENSQYPHLDGPEDLHVFSS